MEYTVKLKGIWKLPDTYLEIWAFRDFVHKHNPEVQLVDDGKYKLSVSMKVGKRRKLKKMVVRYYNVTTCDCCCPHFVLQKM